jgi:hypothetical protein
MDLEIVSVYAIIFITIIGIVIIAYMTAVSPKSSKCHKLTNDDYASVKHIRNKVKKHGN